MMSRRGLLVTPFALVALVAAGCGTVANHTEPGGLLNGRGYTPYRPYGGVLVDADMALVNARRAVGLESGYDNPDIDSILAAGGFLFVDLPMSVAADTVLLPLDVANTLMGKGRPPEGGWPLLHAREQPASTVASSASP
jgi:uncharacterized protein YceK